MKIHNLLIFFCVIFIFLCFSQNKAQAQIPTYVLRSLNIDSIYNNTNMPVVFANEIFVFPQKHFKTNREKKRYNKLKRNFIKVYPFALLIEEEFVAIEKVLDKLPTEKERKAYVRKKDKEMMDEYKRPLKKLNLSQGYLLVKLVDRQTGNTAYGLIEELKGSVVAFFWQGIALLFNNDLKAEYDAEFTDKEIEELVTLWEHGCL